MAEGNPNPGTGERQICSQRDFAHNLRSVCEGKHAVEHVIPDDLKSC